MQYETSELVIGLYLLNIVLVLITIFHMLYQRRSPQNLVAWILALILLPFVGIFFYVIFGSRKLLYKKNKPNISLEARLDAHPKKGLAKLNDTLLSANQINSTTAGNKITFHQSAVETYQQFVQTLESAESQIYLETYSFELDITGQEILALLVRKASAGVKVRLLMDAVGSLSIYRNQQQLNALTDAGGQYSFFQPLFKNILNSQLNLRNHRKIYLIDSRTLFTGGMNLSNNYFGSQINEPKEGYWVDLLFKMEGPIVDHYQKIFNEDWHYTTQERLLVEKTSFSEPTTGRGFMQTIPSGPDINSDTLFESILQSIYFAKRQIVIVTPYFIPDSAIVNALMIAIKRGVKVILITPETSDHLIFDLGRGSFMREFLEHGGEIHCYAHGMMHAKLVLIDDKAALFGSANLDYRSLFINYEVTNITYSKQFITLLSDWIDNLISQSVTYQPADTKLRLLLENLARTIAPIL
ncbi:cardiolipin synthase [Hydrogenovibrio sp. 3SP14C1]|uniref:cardiolipin synthase n=1 Tax=Hydrogenovibrio sp. 3SP14C1 TaxID=3038774 RepID=UPI0024179FA9|nr:cardiolipin synthase [Hydrogenovibrio sp. 3SP14C1]MDG4812388.1 cardiolipin synthase [Hydrogenovibrio sp. 3SP14C1]